MQKVDIYCKKLKYTTKTNKYINKLSYNIYEQQGGFIKYTQQNGDNYKDTKKINTEELFDYIQKRVDKIAGKTKEKYLVILMGAPGSGKTLARKLTAKYITKYIEGINEPTDEDCNKTFNSFVDISIDDFVYDSQIIEGEYTRLIDRDVENGRNKFKHIATEYKEAEDDNIDRFVEKSKQLYFGMRPHFDTVGEIILNLSAYLSANIFFETIGNEGYIKNLIENFCKYNGYNLVIVYPFIANETIHLKRVRNRGAVEGRFVNNDYVRLTRASSDALFDALPSIVRPHISNKLLKSSLIKFENKGGIPLGYNFAEFNDITHHSYRYIDDAVIYNNNAVIL